MQKGSNMTVISVSYSIVNVCLAKGPNIFGHQHIFGQVYKVNGLYATAVADCYFNAVCYLVGLFLKGTGHSQWIPDYGEF